MSLAINTRDAGTAAASKRLKKSTAVTSVGATGVYTVDAGWLDDLAPGDTIVLSGLTGGSGVVADTTYYLAQPRWNAGATTFKISATPDGAVLTGGSNITAGTVSSGLLTVAADGVKSGNYISANSPLGR